MVIEDLMVNRVQHPKLQFNPWSCQVKQQSCQWQSSNLSAISAAHASGEVSSPRWRLS